MNIIYNSAKWKLKIINSFIILKAFVAKKSLAAIFSESHFPHYFGIRISLEINTPAKLCFECYNLLSTLYTTGRKNVDNI